MTAAAELLSPSERVKILSARLVNLRNGAGDYAPESRSQEIERTQEAIRRAFQDYEMPVASA